VDSLYQKHSKLLERYLKTTEGDKSNGLVDAAVSLLGFDPMRTAVNDFDT